MAGATLAAGRGPLLLGLTWTWTTIATFLFILRAVNASKAPKEHKNLFGLRLDFCWVTLAYITAVSAEVFLTISVVYGTGNHQELLTPSQAVNSAFWSWVGQICAIFALVWARFAVVAFLVALQGRAYTKWKHYLYFVGGLQFLINAIEVVLILKQCEPTQKLWDSSIPGTCPLIETCAKVGYLQGAIGAFSDFSLALYPPAVIIGPLQVMSIRVKVALCLIMGGGVVAGIAGIIKTVEIEGILRTTDISYATVPLLIMVMTEVWFIIIFGSLPALRSTFVSAGKRALTATGRTARSKNKSEGSFPDSNNHNADWVELAGKRSSGRLNGGHRVYVTSHGNGMRSMSNDSEERILSDEGIVLTTETKITSTEA